MPVPVFGGLFAIVGDEVAVADLKAAAEFAVAANRLVELGQPLTDAAGQTGVRALCREVLLEGAAAVVRPVGRLQRLEGETPAQRVVDQGQRPVGGVHHAEDVDVRGDVESLVGIGEGDGVVLAPLVVLDEHEEFAEDARQVAPVDLVDDEDVAGVRLGPRAFAEAVEDAVLEGEAAAVGGAEALDEVFVGVGLVELDHLDGVVVLVADQAPGDSAGDEGFTGAGGALEDEVLAGLDGGEEAGEVGGGDEEVLVGVGGGVGSFGGGGGYPMNHITRRTQGSGDDHLVRRFTVSTRRQ